MRWGRRRHATSSNRAERIARDRAAPAKRADLESDFWSISGPGSFEEFRAIAEHKIQILLARGLSAHLAHRRRRLRDQEPADGARRLPLAEHPVVEGIQRQLE